MKIPNIIKRLFCKHSKTAYLRSYLDDHPNGGYITRHIWKCKECGKEIIGGK